MRAILVLYMNDMLKYTEKQSTMIYHAFTTSCYVCCIFGALIADSFLGKNFWEIFQKKKFPIAN